MTDVVEIRTRQDSHARARLSTVNGGLEGSQLIAPPGHLLVAGGCRVPGCRRTGRAGDGLCGRHGNLWQLEGKPRGFNLAEWVATVAGGPLPCRVPGCSYGRTRKGLCAGHDRRWHREGASDLEEWIASAAPEAGDHTTCHVDGCRLWASGWDGFCLAHSTRFHLSRGPHAPADLRSLSADELRATRRREAEKFIRAEVERNEKSNAVDLAGLEPRLQEELVFLFAAYLESGRRRVALSSWALLVDRLRTRRVITLTSTPLSRGSPIWN